MAEPPEIEDSEFVALCAQYLDLKFDLTQEQPEPDHDHDHFSSPCSNDTDQDGTCHSKQSASTAHTTPLRPNPRLVEEPDFSSLPTFLLHLQYSDMPHASKDLFAMLAGHVCEISSLLVPNARVHEDSIGAVIDHSNAIIAQIQQSAKQIQDQIHNIAYIKSLAPFEVHPTSIDLWCNYRQMVQLIVKYTALPCRTELVLLEHFTHIFDAHVYHPFLQGLHLGRWPRSVENALNVVYDVTMTLLHAYKQWCKAMKDIKQNHILPVLRSIQDSPEILQSIKASEARRDAAKAAMRRDNAPGSQPVDPTLLRRLEQAARPTQFPPRTKEKFRRELTV